MEKPGFFKKFTCYAVRFQFDTTNLSYRQNFLSISNFFNQKTHLN